jgi:rSAM/selenodomain-associated transferase 2
MLSIIVPTYNEADQLAETIHQIRRASGRHEPEVIIVDGGSTDETIAVAAQCAVTVVKSERKGRAAQMNKGASIAKGELLYFLHADSIPPQNFVAQIMNAYHDGAKSACFRLAFDYNHWFLKTNCWFTRFDINAVRFGDQSLFVCRDVFQQAGGFREDLWMMEDQEIIHRLKKYGRFTVMKDVVITSARKYLDNGIYRMQGIFFCIWALHYLGYPQDRLLNLHRRLIRKHKL